MRLKPLVFIAIAIGLRFVSKSVELQGDAAPLIPGGVSTDRLTYHLIALVLLFGAIGFFIAALVSLFRGWRA
jgi:hypothetical protein